VKDSLYTLLYAVVLGLVCATLLTGAARFVEPYYKANAEAERMRNILNVLDVPYDPDAPSKELVSVFRKEVREEEVEGLERYTYVPSARGGAVAAVAVPFEGQGLWGPIKGFLALEPDLRTIRGVAFHKQEETPGLGGEIVSEWFRGQFKGKRIVTAGGEVGIRIRGGGRAADNEVDAITGATLTCQKVEAMINAAIETVSARRKADGR